MLLNIKDIMGGIDKVYIEAQIFGIKIFDVQNDKIFILKVTDGTDSIFVKLSTDTEEKFTNIMTLLKVGNWYRFYGEMQADMYMDEFDDEIEVYEYTNYESLFVIEYKDIVEIENKSINERMDNANEKRVELHAHTMMSQMDGVIDGVKLVKQAIKWGHKAIAITDHDGCQAFPHVFNEVTSYNKGLIAPYENKNKILEEELKFCEDKNKIEEIKNEIEKTKEEMKNVQKFKVLYGTELEMSDDKLILGTNCGELINKKITKVNIENHVNLIAINKNGLKNLFKLISLANTEYLVKSARIPKNIINEYREDILVGSGCYNSEVFKNVLIKNEEELKEIMEFYDYIEVQPPSNYSHLVANNDIKSMDQVKLAIEKIVKCAKEIDKLVVATCDAHTLNKEDKIYREIIVNHRDPLDRYLNKLNYNTIPDQYFRTTDEMLEEFSFLGEDLAKEIVVTNTNLVSELCEEIEVIIDTNGVPFSPRIDNSVETVIDLVYTKAESWYGNPLPFNIEERIAKELYGDAVYKCIKERVEKEKPELEGEEKDREIFNGVHNVILEGFDAVKDLIRESLKNIDSSLEGDALEDKVKKELGGIIGGGFEVIYLIAQKLVKKSNDDGFLVGSRGAVGSSFVATMMGITEVNALPAHYRCPECKHSIFDDEDGNALGATYSSGFDLPDMSCPKCGTNMIKDGQDMPFATFLGFNADKVPDIDLNFSHLNQAAIHEYTKVLFGEDNVYRAGTIGTVANRLAFLYVKEYCEDRGINVRTAEIERLAEGCIGVKRTTGQHPGGIVVIPGYMDVFDFTPFQYPGDVPYGPWRTTHFDYHAIIDNVLKLDILGHADQTQLKLIQDITGDDVTKVPLDDKDTMGIFLSPEPLGVTSEQIMCETGTLGVPEFGTGFTIGMLVDTKPKSFAELVKLSGLSHGTDVWLGNAQELIRSGTVEFKDVIGCRDDIMVYLMYRGVEPIKAFEIMEFVRKGKATRDSYTWEKYTDIMRKAGIEEWYIESCCKIKYIFPKAHAAAYVINAFRIAYYKVHKPIVFYATCFSTRFEFFDIETMGKGYKSIKNKIIEIQNKYREITYKDKDLLETLKLALEATARGIKFGKIDLMKSDAKNFIIDEDGKTLIPPFCVIDGLGDVVAKNICEEAKKRPFISIEDFQNRCKVSRTIVDKMRNLGIFDGMSETNQLSLF